MSVDFYSCDHCGDSIYEEYVGHCSVCGHNLCTNCLVNKDIDSRYAYEYGVKFDGSEEQKKEYGIQSKEEDKYGYEIGDIIDDVGIDSKYCPFCSGGVIHNDELLDFALSLLKKSKEELKILYREKSK